MGWGKAIGGVFEAWNKWREGRRGRIRVKLADLRKRKKNILNSSPSKGQSQRLHYIVKQIKKMERELTMD